MNTEKGLDEKRKKSSKSNKSLLYVFVGLQKSKKSFPCG